MRFDEQLNIYANSPMNNREIYLESCVHQAYPALAPIDTHALMLAVFAQMVGIEQLYVVGALTQKQFDMAVQLGEKIKEARIEQNKEVAEEEGADVSAEMGWKSETETIEEQEALEDAEIEDEAEDISNEVLSQLFPNSAEYKNIQLCLTKVDYIHQAAIAYDSFFSPDNETTYDFADFSDMDYSFDFDNEEMGRNQLVYFLASIHNSLKEPSVETTELLRKITRLVYHDQLKYFDEIAQIVPQAEQAIVQEMKTIFKQCDTPFDYPDSEPIDVLLNQAMILAGQDLVKVPFDKEWIKALQASYDKQLAAYRTLQEKHERASKWLKVKGGTLKLLQAPADELDQKRTSKKSDMVETTQEQSVAELFNISSKEMMEVQRFLKEVQETEPLCGPYAPALDYWDKRVDHHNGLAPHLHHANYIAFFAGASEAQKMYLCGFLTEEQFESVCQIEKGMIEDWIDIHPKDEYARIPMIEEVFNCLPAHPDLHTPIMKQGIAAMRQVQEGMELLDLNGFNVSNRYIKLDDLKTHSISLSQDEKTNHIVALEFMLKVRNGLKSSSLSTILNLTELTAWFSERLFEGLKSFNPDDSITKRVEAASDFLTKLIPGAENVNTENSPVFLILNAISALGKDVAAEDPVYKMWYDTAMKPYQARVYDLIKSTNIQEVSSCIPKCLKRHEGPQGPFPFDGLRREY